MCSSTCALVCVCVCVLVRVCVCACAKYTCVRACVHTSGEDPRVHEGGHAEVGQSEEEDDGDVEGDHRGQVVRQPWAPGGGGVT